MTAHDRNPNILRSRVLVAGAGVSGRGCVATLRGLGTQVTVADADDAAREKLAADSGASAMTIDEALEALAAFDLVVTSPGWRPDSELLVAAREAGIEVIGDVELAYRLDEAEVFGPKRTWMVVTGTNGKTTTTGMLASIMGQDAEHSGRRALAVGNIGVSIFDALVDPKRVDVLVAELSSFQLHWSSRLRPDVGVLLNLADDHIDWHGSFHAYAQDKAKALCGSAAVIGLDDAAVIGIAERMSADSADKPGPLARTVVGFSAGAGAGTGKGAEARIVGERTLAGRVTVVEVDGREYLAAHGFAGLAPQTILVSTARIQPSGMAGVLDAAAASAAALLAGADLSAVAAGLAGYRVAGHRGAVVHRGGGISFVDNSKATNPHAADAALRGLDSVVWLAGGQLKGADVSQLIISNAAKLKAAVLIGVDRAVIASSLAEHAPEVPVHVVDETDPDTAMEQAVAACLESAAPGDTVLLAPAAASLDMFTGMAERGEKFTTAVRKHR